MSLGFFKVFTLVLLIPLATGIVVNTRVYWYFPLSPLELEYRLLNEGVCVGFLTTTTLERAVIVQPGRPVCSTSRGESVYESVHIHVRASPGTTVYSRLVKLHVTTTKPLVLHLVVEYPSRTLNATLTLHRGRNLVSTLQLSSPQNRLLLYVEPGVTEYTIGLKTTCYKQGVYIFRVGVYVANI